MTPIAVVNSIDSKLRRWLLGSHPYNTVFNFNWVNIRPLVKTFRELAGLLHGRIADLGAGASPYYELVKARATSYIAIDYPSAMPHGKARGIKRAAGTMEAIPLASESVDGLICSQVMPQIRQPEMAMREIARVLRRNGCALISVPHVCPLQCEPYDLFRFTPDGLRMLAESAGLKVRGIHVQGLLFSSFALCLAMSLVLSPPEAGESMRLIPWRQIVFAPLIGMINVLAWGLDALFPCRRMPTNFVLVAVKE